MHRFSKDIIIPILFFGITFGVIFYINKRKKEVLKRLLGHLSGSISKFSLFPSFNGEYQGLRFSIVLIPAGEDSPPYLKISLIKNSVFRLSIYKESFLSNMGKKLGLVHEVKINDEMFDRDFLIFSNKPNNVISYLSNTDIKSAIRDLFNNSFNTFLIDGKKLIVQKPNYTNSDLEPAKIKDVLEKLSLLTLGL